MILTLLMMKPQSGFQKRKRLLILPVLVLEVAEIQTISFIKPSGLTNGASPL